MQKRVERLQAWGADVKAKLKARSFKAWAVVVVGMLFVDWIRALALGGATSVIGRLLAVLLWFAGLPMGFLGVGVLVYIVVLLGLAFYDTRLKIPTVQEAEVEMLRSQVAGLSKELQKHLLAEGPKPLPLTVQEENLAHFARLFWEGNAELPGVASKAMHTLVVLTRKIQDTLRPTDPAVDLLGPPTWSLESAKQRLWDVFEVRQSHPDLIVAALRTAVDRYMSLAQWVHYFQDSCALDFDKPPFIPPDTDVSWPTLHRQFKTAFAELCARKGFETLEHFQNYKMPKDRLLESQTGLGEKGRALDLLLSQRSDDETDFLKLLAPDADGYDEPGPPILAHATYRAGQELARKGLFVIRELREKDVHTELFTVPRHVVPFLKRHLFPESEMKIEIRLRLSRVHCSGASGSGAPSSSHH
jgi:hypothetical protein